MVEARAEASTEAIHPASAGLHAVSSGEALQRLLDGQAAALAAVRAAIPAIAAAAEAGAAALGGGGRMGYAGAGSSGLMALCDALELAGTFGIPGERTPILFPGGAASLLLMANAAEDDAGLAEADVARAGLGRGDLLVAVSASGTTPYALACARAARAAGAAVAGIANVPGSALFALADHAILLDTGPEVVAGSTRMGAGTAQKCALNMLSTLVAIRLGHVHDGLMVNVVADNEKLRGRAARIVAALSGAGPEAARAALDAAGGAVKPAVLVARGASPEQARAALEAADGHLSHARWSDASSADRA